MDRPADLLPLQVLDDRFGHIALQDPQHDLHAAHGADKRRADLGLEREVDRLPRPARRGFEPRARVVIQALEEAVERVVPAAQADLRVTGAGGRGGPRVGLDDVAAHVGDGVVEQPVVREV